MKEQARGSSQGWYETASFGDVQKKTPGLCSISFVVSTTPAWLADLASSSAAISSVSRLLSGRCWWIDAFSCMYSYPPTRLRLFNKKTSGDSTPGVSSWLLYYRELYSPWTGSAPGVLRIYDKSNIECYFYHRIGRHIYT